VKRRPPSAEWLALRARVRAVAKQRGLDLAALASTLGVARSTMEGALNRHCRPSQRLLPLFEAFVVPRDGEPPAPAVRSAAAAAPDPAPTPAELSRRLRAKRRLVPLTGATLAARIGVAVDTLDQALAGQPVAPAAAQRLQAWASA
jgi:transcriptional regulator with XRE-family HTH domain